MEKVVAETDRAAVFFTVSGTHEGSFLGLPATGRQIEFRGVRLVRLVRLVRFKGSHMAHERFLYDFSGMLVKLGVLRVSPDS